MFLQAVAQDIFGIIRLLFWHLSGIPRRSFALKAPCRACWGDAGVEVLLVEVGCLHLLISPGSLLSAGNHSPMESPGVHCSSQTI